MSHFTDATGIPPKNELMAMAKSSKFAHIFDEVSAEELPKYVAETDDETFERENKTVATSLNSFFGIEEEDLDEIFNSTDDQFAFIEEDKDAGNRLTKANLEREQAEKFTEQWLEKNLAMIDYASTPDAGKYALSDEERIAEEEKYGMPTGSRTTDRVVERRSERQGSLFNDTTNKASNTLSMNSGGSTTSRMTSSSTTKDGEKKTKRGIDHFADMNRNVQTAAAKRNPSWLDPSPDEVKNYFADQAHEKKWWQKAIHKTKNFFKSGKGRVTLKVAMVLALQMSMAVYGKKYEFENTGQMVAMLGFMVGSFFLTRELAEEGIDVSGMIF